MFDASAERVSVTWENDCETREPDHATAPVTGTMLATGTKTGRLSSSGRVARAASFKLMSTAVGRSRLSAYVLAKVVCHAGFGSRMFALTFARQLDIGWKSLATSATGGADSASDVDVAEHCVGMPKT